MSIETDTVDAIGVHRAVIDTPHAAVFRTPRGRHKPVDALAAWLTVHDIADRVGTAGVLARINAAMFVTDRVHRTIFGTGAVSFRLAAVHVRIAHMIRRASAHWVIRWTGDAERRWMAGVRMACFHGDALDVGHRIRTKSRRALTDRFVVVRDADRVHAARILIASIVASVRESVAELRRRTVDVVDTGHCAAPGYRVIWIASILPGRTFAVRHVIVDNAKRVGTAGDEVADQLASERTVRGAATRLILRALAIRGATILARTVTASAVIRIAGVAR